jgi:hypothetical protein
LFERLAAQFYQFDLPTYPQLNLNPCLNLDNSLYAYDK